MHVNQISLKSAYAVFCSMNRLVYLDSPVDTNCKKRKTLFWEKWRINFFGLMKFKTIAFKLAFLSFQSNSELVYNAKLTLTAKKLIQEYQKSAHWAYESILFAAKNKLAQYHSFEWWVINWWRMMAKQKSFQKCSIFKLNKHDDWTQNITRKWAQNPPSTVEMQMRNRKRNWCFFYRRSVDCGPKKRCTWLENLFLYDNIGFTSRHFNYRPTSA